MKTSIYCTVALLAFAANSVLCRLALGEGSIDAAGFTSIRLFSGALVLALLVKGAGSSALQPQINSRLGPWLLFIYALSFSYGYLSLDTGTGALILFASVQLTMVVFSLLSGTRLSRLEWVGLVIAFSGLAYLLLPGSSAPSPLGFFLMSLSGVAWGLYTLSGKVSTAPLQLTYDNFLKTLPLVVLLFVVAFFELNITWRGALLALLSGGVASGIGYAVWFKALEGLKPIEAAVYQLLVPVLAMFAGVVFADEALSSHLVVSSLIVLGGILALLFGRYKTIPV